MGHPRWFNASDSATGLWAGSRTEPSCCYIMMERMPTSMGEYIGLRQPPVLCVSSSHRASFCITHQVCDSTQPVTVTPQAATSAPRACSAALHDPDRSWAKPPAPVRIAMDTPCVSAPMSFASCSVPCCLIPCVMISVICTYHMRTTCIHAACNMYYAYMRCTPHAWDMYYAASHAVLGGPHCTCSGAPAGRHPHPFVCPGTMWCTAT